MMEFVKVLLPETETHLLFVSMLLDLNCSDLSYGLLGEGSHFIRAVNDFVFRPTQAKTDHDKAKRTGRPVQHRTRCRDGNDRRATLRRIYRVLKQEAWFGEFGDQERGFLGRLHLIKSYQPPVSKWRELFTTHPVFNRKLYSILTKIIWTDLEAETLYAEFTTVLTRFLCGLSEGRTEAEVLSYRKAQIVAILSENSRRFSGYGFTFHDLSRRISNYRFLARSLGFNSLQQILGRVYDRLFALKQRLRVEARLEAVVAAGREIAQHLARLQSTIRSLLNTELNEQQH